MSDGKEPLLFKKGYKVRIYPNKTQQQFLAQTFGCCRYLWNKVLRDTTAEYQAHKADPSNPKPRLSQFDLTYRVKTERHNPETPWLKEAPATAQLQAMRDLGDAYSRFLTSQKAKSKRKVGYPKPKSRKDRQSFRLMVGAFKVTSKETGYAFTIAKLATPIKVKWGRPLPSAPSNVTISMTPDGLYYASFLCEYAPTPTSGTKHTGIDMGLSAYATYSDGTQIDNPKWLKTHLDRLKQLQRALTRKQKGSSNYTRNKHQIAKLHHKVANARHDWQHKLTRTLVNENQVIGVETLAVSNMVKNRRLSKAISDAAWAAFIAKLEYKVRESQHVTLVKMARFYPSTHICSVTDEKLDYKLKLSERTWDCPYCGQTHDRDVNAATNILHRAQEYYAREHHRVMWENNIPGTAKVVKDLRGQVVPYGADDYGN